MPNTALWENYEQFGHHRGRMICYILSQMLPLKGAHILDFGCGTGGISIELDKWGARLTAVDTNPKKLAHLRNQIKPPSGIHIDNALPTVTAYFDAIILLDVIEHIEAPIALLRQLCSMLKQNGFLYISTPNKYSPLHIFSDPHFSLPGVALMSRRQVRYITSTVLHWQDKKRRDFPQLFSLRRLNKILYKSGFDWSFLNRQVVQYGLEQPQAIWNRNSHLRIYDLLKRLHLLPLLQKSITDQIDVFNRWLNPTWYLVAKKKQ